MVLVGDGLLLDVERQLDAAVADRQRLGDVTVGKGCCGEYLVGHLAGDGAYALVVLDAPA